MRYNTTSSDDCRLVLNYHGKHNYYSFPLTTVVPRCSFGRRLFICNIMI